MNLLELAIQAVSELGQTPVPRGEKIMVWQSEDGQRKVYLESARDGLDLLMVANGKCSRPLTVGYVAPQGDGWTWAASKALGGLPEADLGRRTNTVDSCYETWVADTQKRLGLQ